MEVSYLGTLLTAVRQNIFNQRNGSYFIIFITMSIQARSLLFRRLLRNLKELKFFK